MSYRFPAEAGKLNGARSPEKRENDGWVTAGGPYRAEPGLTADLDGDGVPEWIGVYRWRDDLYVMVYRRSAASWVPASALRGYGDELGVFYAAPLTRPDRWNVVAGWQDAVNGSRLAIYEWTGYGLMDFGPGPARPLIAGSGFTSVLPPEPAEARLAPAAVRTIPLYPVTVKTVQGNLWGYIDEHGQMILPPRFEYANDYQDNGLAVVGIGGKQGVIDAHGRYVVQPIYESISPFSEGLASVIDKKGYRVIDDLGHILTPKAYDYIGAYHDGRALFYLLDAGGLSRYGYLNQAGQEAIPAQYLDATDFANGRALVKVKEGEYALIGTDGRRLAVYKYAFVGSPGDGLLSFQQTQNGKHGYIDEKGTVVIPPRFSIALPFENGRAVVNLAEDYHNLYGLIDKTGAYVIQPEYNDISLLGEQRAAVGKAIDPKQPFIGSRYALADSGSGQLLTGFEFGQIGGFQQGYASVFNDRYTYWITPAGKPAANLPRIEGSGTMAFIGKLISANVDQRLSYYDRSGKLVWQPPVVLPLRPPIQVREVKFKPNKDYLVYYPQMEGMADPAVQKKVNEKLAELSGVKPVPADKQLDFNYTGDYAVSFFDKNLLVLELYGYNYPFGAAHGMPSRVYVHLNIATGEMYALKDLFKPGAPYTQRLTEIVKKQIATNPEYDYVFPDSKVEVKPDQLFYVTRDALKILFPPYEIAPYAAGYPTFTIPYAEIADILDKNGSFWMSFH